MMQAITLLTHTTTPASGIGTYTKLLIDAIPLSYKKQIQKPLKFLNYPVFIPKTTNLIHITSQDLALPLIFKKYKKCVVTVHDVIPLQYPLFENAQHIRWKKLDKFLFKKTIVSLKNADKIICVSHTTKNALLAIYPKLEKKVVVIHEYPGEEFNNKRKKRNLINLIYVGSELPYKNLPVLFKALAIVKKHIQEIKLIKIGKPNWQGARTALMALAKDLDIEKNIVWKDHVEDLSEEYNRAALLVHPSLHEGFGLPVIEAMACGCPVLASKNASLPEVGGDAALYFNPENPEECGQKIMTIINNKKTQEEMRKKGLENCKKFTKKIFSEKIDAVYKEVLDNNR